MYAPLDPYAVIAAIGIALPGFALLYMRSNAIGEACDNPSSEGLYATISKAHEKREAKRQKKTPDSLERHPSENAPNLSGYVYRDRAEGDPASTIP
jgi:hypothetical protein